MSLPYEELKRRISYAAVRLGELRMDGVLANAAGSMAYLFDHSAHRGPKGYGARRCRVCATSFSSGVGCQLDQDRSCRD